MPVATLFALLLDSVARLPLPYSLLLSTNDRLTESALTEQDTSLIIVIIECFWGHEVEQIY